MACAFVRELPGITADEFDRLRAEVGDVPPPGLIVHVGGPTEHGWRTIEVWESRTEFDRYERELMEPALERFGFRLDSSLQEVVVHHFLQR